MAVLQCRRHELGRVVRRIAEHDALVTSAFVLGVAGVDPLGDMVGLAMEIAAVVGRFPVKAVLFVADVLDRGPDQRLEGLDQGLVAGFVVLLGGAGLGGADFSGQDDAIGGDQGLAGDAGFRLSRQEGVDDGIADPVCNLVRVAFGHALAGEDVILTAHAKAPGA